MLICIKWVVLSQIGGKTSASEKVGIFNLLNVSSFKINPTFSQDFRATSTFISNWRRVKT
jgi:hypothetical protein